MRKVSELRIGDAVTNPIPSTPWAAALNTTAECDEISVTLLSLDVVDDLLRLTGLLRVGDRPDIRVATIPSLQVALPDGTSLPMLDAHVMPHGRLAWISWTYQRPDADPEHLEGTISHIEFEYRGGRPARIDVPGPWDFSILVRQPTTPEVAARPAGSIGRA